MCLLYIPDLKHVSPKRFYKIDTACLKLPINILGNTISDDAACVVGV